MGRSSAAPTSSRRVRSGWRFCVSFRRKGVAPTLIGAVEEEAQRRGLQSAHVEPAVANAAAIPLYELLEYRHQGGPVTDRWSRLPSDGRD